MQETQVYSQQSTWRGIVKLLTLSLLTLFATGPLSAQADGSDQRALQGDWTMVSARLNGQTFTGMAGTRHVSGDTTTVTVNGELLMRATFTLNPAANPRAIDYQILEGPTAGAHQLGIYQISDSTLSFCMGSPGGTRPTEFESNAGDGRTCSVWRRAAAH